MTDMNSRPYRMNSRATSTEQTGERLLDAMRERFGSTPYERIRLEDVAADASVTVQTVIRRFGGKAGLATALFARELARVGAAREAAAHASAPETVRALVEHYETYGLLILKTYSEAPLVPGLSELAAQGRAFHVDWCRRVFADHLDPELDADLRRRRVAQVTAICDATTWRNLRYDGGLDPAETEQALLDLISPLLHEDSGFPPTIGSGGRKRSR